MERNSMTNAMMETLPMVMDAAVCVKLNQAGLVSMEARSLQASATIFCHLQPKLFKEATLFSKVKFCKVFH